MELDLASLPTLTVVQLRGLPATTNLRKEILIKSLTAWAEAQEVETEEAPEEEPKEDDANSNHSGEERHQTPSEEEEERSSLDTVTRGRPKASGRKRVLSGGENPSIRERELEAQLAYIALEADKLALEKKKWASKEKKDGSSEKETEVSLGGGFAPRLPKGVVPAYVEGDDIDKWLGAFERALQMRKVKPQYWGSLLWELVPNSGRDRLLTMSGEDADSYPSMKSCLTKKFGLTPEQYRLKFRDTQKTSTQSWVEFVDISVKALEGWIQGNRVSTFEGLYNLIMREHLLTNCVQERLRQYLVDSRLTNPRELGEAADDWLRTRVNQRPPGGDQKKGGHGSSQGKNQGKDDKKPKESSQESPKTSQGGGAPSQFTFKGKGYQGKNFDPAKAGKFQELAKAGKCFDCYQPGHKRGDAICTKKPPTGGQSQGIASVGLGVEVGPGVESGYTEVTLVSVGGVDIATMATLPPIMQRYRQRPKVNGTEVEALRDTGASVTMVAEKLVSPEQVLPGVFHQVTYADTRTKLHPMAMVSLEWGGVTGPKKVAVAPALPVECLLGNDLEASEWSEVERRVHAKMLDLPEWVCAVTRSQAAQQGNAGHLDPGTMGQASKKKRKGTGSGLPAPTSTEGQEESNPEGEDLNSEGGTPSLQTLPDLAELQGAGGPTREDLCQGQRECPTLEGLRQTAARQEQGDTSGTHKVYWEDGVLYTEARTLKEGATRRVVVPQKYREFLLTLSHDIPLAGHLGQTKTWNRLVNHFFWPEMSEKVREFCSSCVTCQASGKTGGKPKAPLIPLPVVGTPFERVGIDIVGPLDPPTASGNRYIVVVVDHATRYPEAIPLRTITAPTVARALLGVFTRVGFPKEVVSDRGTNFMSAYLKAMWEECGVTYKFSTPYHPQTNGLVERFNKTLKGMIMGLSDKLRRRWDVLLPCLLFAYREVPQKGVGFSPFELLFGHPVRGPLCLVRESWEKPLKEAKENVLDYVLGLRSRMAEYMKKASRNLEASQELMKLWHDQKATMPEYHPGQLVWVLEPMAPRALQAKWTGPYPILEKKGEVTYLVDLGTPRNPHRILHVNRMKPHQDRADMTMLMVTDEGKEEEGEPLPDLLSSKEKDGSVEGVVLSPKLTDQQQQDCKQVLGQFASLFSLTPGLTNWCVHDVDTGDSLPVKNKLYRLSDQVKANIKAEVAKMLDLKVIEPSDSPWSSPVVLVPKANPQGGKKELRFCVDYRGLNAVTRTDAHPIPRADELIDRLGAAKFLSTFDLTSGYWQIALSPRAKERSAFSTPEGHFQFKVMPFGMKNAPATFQRLVNRVLSGLESFSAAYLDDIAVFSSTWRDHLVHLKEVLQALLQAGLTIKASKCQIGQSSVVYLGHLVGGGHVQPLQPKIQTILDWEAPKTQTQVRAFLGLTGYYRRFVQNFGTIVAPLTELTSKKQPKKVIWTPECQKAFDTLKQAMCSAPVLLAPDYSKEFVVQTDASEEGIGAVLAQVNEEGHDHPVAFISRRLLPREKKWSAIEREAFAVVWSLKKLRPYLFGTHFRVQTDHRPLRWLMQMRGENPKLLRWSISLQGMDFTVEHRPGTAHANADGLSRFFHLADEDYQGVG
ncbi:hypothetical protein NDU88_007864 [Pleurodeles waltl]|uniref:Gypsy retrotransposon integrase-like protein 1 n=1 Tax=Pleurodeles waltl TaxID=8319 RepID=A0AAV7STK9_PLEWA|nr:hypothetical protein NDU88_007864 [Pleurodeles waltl]